MPLFYYFEKMVVVVVVWRGGGGDSAAWSRSVPLFGWHLLPFVRSGSLPSSPRSDTQSLVFSSSRSNGPAIAFCPPSPAFQKEHVLFFVFLARLY